MKIVSREQTINFWLNEGVDLQIQVHPLYPGVVLPSSLARDCGLVCLNIWPSRPETTQHVEVSDDSLTCTLSFDTPCTVTIPFGAIAGVLLEQGGPNELLLAWPGSIDVMNKVIQATLKEKADAVYDIFDGKKPKLKLMQ